MPEAIGTIPLPGTSVVAQVKPADILASYSPPPLIKGGVIKSGQTSVITGITGIPTGLVIAGTALDYEAGTKKYIISAAGTAAVGVLMQDVDTSKGDVLGNVILSGTLKAEKIIGFGAAGTAAAYPSVVITTQGVVSGLGGRAINRSAAANNVDDYYKF